jgi:hypothetical protein
MRRTQLQRSYYIPIIGEQIEGCVFSKGDYLTVEKENVYLVPSFWNICFFFVFFKCLTSLKKNKRMLRYKGGTSVVDKKTSSKRMEY